MPVVLLQFADSNHLKRQMDRILIIVVYIHF